MKKLIASLMIALMIPMTVHAAEGETNPHGDPVKIRCTCYTAKPDAITASGQTVREGIVAGKRQWMKDGCVAILYDMDMNFIGCFEFLDTGFGIDTDGDGIGSIQEGKSIDVFRDSLDGCYEWIGMYGDYVYMQIVKGVG